MTENEKMKLLHEEITTAAIRAKTAKGTQHENIYRAYIAGMQFVVAVLAGEKRKSGLPGGAE